MGHKQQRPLPERVVEAAEDALSSQGYASLIDVLVRMGWLHPVHVEAWRRGRLDCLEEMIRAHPNNLSNAMALFREWAINRHLNASETAYLVRTTGAPRDLRFGKSSDPEI